MTLPATAHATAYIKEGRLCVMGISDTELGPIPFSYSVEVKDKPDGPVDFNDEELDPDIAQAIDRPGIMRAIQESKMRVAAEQLVERSRCGDQNAIVQVQAIGINARKGNPRAQTAFKIVQEYIKDNPPGKEPRPTVTGRTAITRMLKSNLQDNRVLATFLPGLTNTYISATVLSKGPVLSPNRLEDIASQFGEDAPLFWVGFRARGTRLRKAMQRDPQGKRAMIAGRACKIAWTLQGVAMGKLPLRSFCPATAWELED
jgi:hypothetical protein